jgi:hypothetical protein
MIRTASTGPSSAAVAGVLVASSLAVLGCGSSGNGPSASGGDAAANDSALPPDATSDSPAPGESGGPIDGTLPDGATPDSGVSPELALFCQKYSAAYCDDQVACGFPNLPPRAACVDGWNRECLTAVAAASGALSSGRVVFDPTAVDACLADAAGPFCTTNNISAASCSLVFRPTVPPGGTCYAPYFGLLLGGTWLNECDGGICSATIHSCPGQCLAYLKAGDPCMPQPPLGTAFCGPGTYCDGMHCQTSLPAGSSCNDLTLRCASPLVCVPSAADGALSCEPTKGQGQACQVDAECDRFYCLTQTCRAGHVGEECAAYLQCDPGLVCTGAAGCQMQIAQDGACDPTYAACATGLSCEQIGLDDAGLPVGACHTPRSPTAGQPCFNGMCAAGFWCQTASTPAMCMAAGKAGDPCEGGIAASCATGLVCDGDKHQCQMPSVAGGPCSADWAGTCAAGFGCGAAMTCEPKVGAGSACDATGVCNDGLYCDGTCKPAKLPGSQCTGKPGECIGGACDTTSGTCNGDCVDPG